MFEYRKYPHSGTIEDYYWQLLRHWDFEVLLAELRSNPVMRGETDHSFIVLHERGAHA